MLYAKVKPKYHEIRKGNLTPKKKKRKEKEKKGEERKEGKGENNILQTYFFRISGPLGFSNLAGVRRLLFIDTICLYNVDH
jgi:hypothetical protein